MTARPAGTRARRTGPGRALIAGWRVFVPSVVGNAVLQGLLVLGDPVAGASAGFALRVVASAGALVLTVTVVAGTALAAIDGRRPAGPGPVGPLVRVAVWTAGLGVLAATGAVLTPWAGPLFLLLGPFVLPAAAAGAPRPLVAGLALFRSAPIRVITAVLGFLALAALSWVVALLLGFLVTGVVAAIATWLWFGAVIVVVLCGWTSLFRRETASG